MQHLRGAGSLDEALGFFPEFQELILIWHVATDIVLLENHEHLSKNRKEVVKAIEALSNYMTILSRGAPSHATRAEASQPVRCNASGSGKDMAGGK
jgi:hypothetical protein